MGKKPLSRETLARRYMEAGLSPDQVYLLSQYFLCFSNLYGVISVSEAWNIFRNYEGVRLLHRKDFYAFSGIVAREPDISYSVLEPEEIYGGEPTGDPGDRLIVDFRLIGIGSVKYTLVINMTEQRLDVPYYLPDGRAEFLTFMEDPLLSSPEWKQMESFLSALKTAGIYKDFDGKPKGEILDPEGNPVAGKRLSEAIFYTPFERFELDREKNEAKRNSLLEAFQATALQKFNFDLMICLQAGGYAVGMTPSDHVSFLLELLDLNMGVEMTSKQLDRFVSLYFSLNNRTHLWMHCGWRSDELGRAASREFPGEIKVGRNLRELFESGELDRPEFERELKNLGIKLK